MIEFWKMLWSILLFGGLGAFALLFVVVTIGGFRDLRALFRSLNENRDERR
ncbi:MAG: hypothetical protein ACPGXK_15255 [Phycisphaerae bacterium]